MDFVQLMREFGVPLAFLAALCTALWRAGRWVGVEVLKPLVDQHIAFLAELKQTVRDMALSISRSGGDAAEALREIREHRDEWREWRDREGSP